MLEAVLALPRNLLGLLSGHLASEAPIRFSGPALRVRFVGVTSPPSDRVSPHGISLVTKTFLPPLSCPTSFLFMDIEFG